ncbi:carbohydrate ABC transporter permease [Chelativorans sp.]|uniref:carbohydrate ABC transporter permease n=1 Tax=Chelativorans sp. TaxID=2203393 RepID=UPI00281114B2|nr:carbohydrate ABC transporter permease [Chelativorans sp.]
MTREPIATTLFALCAGVIALYITFPILWLILASFKPASELARLPATILPDEFTLGAYRDLLTAGTQSSQLLDWRRLIANSFFISVTSTVIVVVLASIAGYAFARIPFPGRDLILGGLLVSRMFQGAVLLLPTYRLMVFLGLHDSPWALILIYSAFGLPFATWIITAGLREIPMELEEAAMVDGASRLQTMIRVILPLAVPSLVTAALWHFVGSWAEFAFASILLESPEKKTVTLGLVNFVDYFTLEFNRVGAAAGLVALPILVIFFFGQRYFTRGLLQGAVKG